MLWCIFKTSTTCFYFSLHSNSFPTTFLSSHVQDDSKGFALATTNNTVSACFWHLATLLSFLTPSDIFSWSFARIAKFACKSLVEMQPFFKVAKHALLAASCTYVWDAGISVNAKGEHQCYISASDMLQKPFSGSRPLDCGSKDLQGKIIRWKRSESVLRTSKMVQKPFSPKIDHILSRNWQTKPAKPAESHVQKIDNPQNLNHWWTYCGKTVRGFVSFHALI